MGVSVNSSSELIAFLQTVDAGALTNSTVSVLDEANKEDTGMVWVPVIESMRKYLWIDKT